MARWFWYFLVYSFLGFCLEVLFARVTGAEKRDRKCFLLAPLCPVYGAGALTILALPPFVRSRPLLLLVCAAACATAVEYLFALFYERVAHVQFWDYRDARWHLQGRVCPAFSLCWGLLGLALTGVVQPWLSALPAPGFWLWPAALFLLCDGLITLRLLRRTRSTDVLRWYRLLPSYARRSPSMISSIFLRGK
ncbi:putative ABC transporter permease [Pseudoflavonifractor phocaeensis]|uniref:putative ABC transporter permease n=1 Tax=Pseudoflavonifractor phocaeensis TaxID=1870988 RepID=UPI0019584116|nr:putative ABC transporter permease [Pseudoflavonifractor phocaeensis]MBM6870019.1 putative ABC transporter permease [Pseudoflavonifractor phocaeensis]MBM6939351.1 putative ABC transporter permease [Pseudoflavonifractor phocaeensis]